MTLDNKIKTNLNLSSQYENNSIKDSVFFNSSISVDVICVSGLIIVVLIAVALFLRLSKRLRQVEDEIVIVSRLLRRKSDLTGETLCYKRISYLTEQIRQIYLGTPWDKLIIGTVV